MPRKAPLIIETTRLLLRKPDTSEAEAIFERYAGDPDIGCYLRWPIHQTIDDTKRFLEFSESEWLRWPAGPYLIYSMEDGKLLGSTDIAFVAPDRASTGYVIAKDSWGRGYATEAALAMRKTAADLDVERLFAASHPNHAAYQRVLEKAGFHLEGKLRRHIEFPNHQPGVLQDALYYFCSPNRDTQFVG